MTIKEEILNTLKESSETSFRSDILTTAENNELTTPGHVLQTLSKKGKVPTTFHDQQKAMKFVIDTIKSYGGHFAISNPKLMKYIDNM